MPYCQKCGVEVSDEMAFCPKCGAALKAKQPAEQAPVRHLDEKAEKREKEEKYEKHEKQEKQEKGEFSFIGPLIGGLILIFLGLMSYLQITGALGREFTGAMFFIVIGIVIIVVGLYAAMRATRRHPRI